MLSLNWQYKLFIRYLMLCNFLRLHILLACLYSQNENVLSCPSSMGQLCHFRHVLNILNSGFCICNNTGTHLIEPLRRPWGSFPHLLSNPLDVSCTCSRLAGWSSSTHNPPRTFPGRKSFIVAARWGACCSALRWKSTSYRSSWTRSPCLMSWATSVPTGKTGTQPTLSTFTLLSPCGTFFRIR